MLNGQCEAEDYEKWVRTNGVRYAASDEAPVANLDSRYNVNLVATYEELLNIPYEQQVTAYFGDYGLHHFRYGITDAQIRPVYEKALAAMEMTEKKFTEQKDAFLYRSEIIQRMRDCLLAKELRTGEKVLFVAPEPYAAREDFALRGGIVLGVDAEEKTCRVRGEFFTMEDVPLHYVLGRHDLHAEGRHYGFENVQPLFGEHPALAQQNLKEVEEAYNMKRNSGQVQDDKSAPVLSMYKENSMKGKMKSVHGIYKKHGREEFLEAAKFYSDAVNPFSIDKTIDEMESRWYDSTHRQTEAEKMVEDYNNGLTILNDPSLACTDTGQGMTM